MADLNYLIRYIKYKMSNNSQNQTAENIQSIGKLDIKEEIGQHANLTIGKVQNQRQFTEFKQQFLGSFSEQENISSGFDQPHHSDQMAKKVEESLSIDKIEPFIRNSEVFKKLVIKQLDEKKKELSQNVYASLVDLETKIMTKIQDVQQAFKLQLSETTKMVPTSTQTSDKDDQLYSIFQNDDQSIKNLFQDTKKLIGNNIQNCLSYQEQAQHEVNHLRSIQISQSFKILGRKVAIQVSDHTQQPDIQEVNSKINYLEEQLKKIQANMTVLQESLKFAIEIEPTENSQKMKQEKISPEVAIQNILDVCSDSITHAETFKQYVSSIFGKLKSQRSLGHDGSTSNEQVQRQMMEEINQQLSSFNLDPQLHNTVNTMLNSMSMSDEQEVMKQQKDQA